MRDGRIGQQALDVLCTSAPTLPRVIESAAATQISQKRPGALASKHDPQQHGECRGLGRGGHEADHRRGRAFVDVGRPDMKRRGSDFETQSHEHQRHAGVGQQLESVRIAAPGRSASMLVDPVAPNISATP